MSKWDSNDGLPEFPLMDADDIRKWQDAGMELASHSRSHPHLPDLADSELENEIAGSRTDLAAMAGVGNITFVYPYGEYNDQIRDEVSRHYKLAFSIDNGLNGLADDALRRAEGGRRG